MGIDDDLEKIIKTTDMDWAQCFFEWIKISPNIDKGTGDD